MTLATTKEPKTVRQQDYDLKKTQVDSKIVGLWHMMTGYHWLYLVALVSLSIAAVARAATFYLLSYFVDDVLLRDGLMRLVPLIAFGFIGLALLQGIFTFAGGRLAAQTGEGIVLRLRNYLYDHLQRLTFSYHDKMQTGELIQRTTSDVDAIRRLFSEQMIGVGRIITLFLISFVALLNLHVTLALLSVIVVPIVIVASYLFYRELGKRYELYQQQEAILSNQLAARAFERYPCGEGICPSRI